jgi:succinoglycan biosynthesis transport protein ExoP
MKQDIPSDSLRQTAARPDMQGANDDGAELDIRAILGKLWRGKWIIAVSVLIAAALGFLLVAQMQPRYLATAKVMFNLDSRNVVNIEDLVVSSGVTENTIQNQVEILKSRSLADRVVARLSLEQNAEFNATLRAPEETFADKLGAMFPLPPVVGDMLRDLGMIAPPPPPPAEIDLEERLALERQRAAEQLPTGLTLAPVRGTRVMEISYVSGSPTTSADIVNAYAEQYIVDQLDAKLEASRAAAAWLGERVEELRVKVKAAEEAIETERARLARNAGQGVEITQQQLEASGAALNLARSEARSAQVVYDRLSQAVAENQDLAVIPEFRASQVITGLRTQEAEIAASAARFSVGNPQRVLAERRIAELLDGMREEASKIVATAMGDLEAKRKREAELAGEVRALEDKMFKQTQEQVQVRQLEREAQASRTLYETFLARLEEAGTAIDLQVADARILSAAEPPALPLAQGKQRTMMAAVALGAICGIGLLFLLEKLNNTFRSPAEVEAMTGIPVLGTIPAMGRRVGIATVAKYFRDKPKSSLAEAVRSLRTSILFSNIDNPPRVLMLTSSIPGEAKSTTSILLATTSRQMGKTAIVVDCDLRLPTIAKLFVEEAARPSPGLLSLLEGTATFEETVFRDPITGLDVLMTKPSEPRSTLNAADILASNRFRDLIASLRAKYDLVILDSPPTLVVADARILSRFADAIIYAVRWDSTPRDAVVEGLKELRGVNAPIAGTVLTVVNEKRARRLAYGGYAYYRGRYREYYVS